MLNKSPDQLELLARVFKALSHPHRLRIFMSLASCCKPGTVCEDEKGMRRHVGQLAQEVHIAPSTVSYHLKELRNAGLIRMERRGQSIACWVDPGVLQALSEFFAAPLSA